MGCMRLFHHKDNIILKQQAIFREKTTLIYKKQIEKITWSNLFQSLKHLYIKPKDFWLIFINVARAFRIK